MHKRDKMSLKNGSKNRQKKDQIFASKKQHKKSLKKSSEKLSEKNDDFFKL